MDKIQKTELKKEIVAELRELLRARTINNKSKAIQILSNTEKRNEYYILHKSSTTKFLDDYILE